MKKVKKNLLLIPAILFSLAISAINVSAADTTEKSEEDSATVATEVSETETEASEKVTEGEYTYVFNKSGDDYYKDHKDLFSDKTVRITKYIGSYKNEIKIPDKINGYKVTAIADDAFANCTASSLVIPDTVNTIGESSFAGMENCSSFSVSGDETYFKSIDGVLYTSDSTGIYAYPVAKEGKEYKVPEGVTEIGPAAFSYTLLEDISLPDSLVYIDEWSFGYSKIKSVKIPDKVTEIDKYAFAYCDNLSDVRLSSSLDYIGDAAFADCSLIKNITLTSKITEIGQCAFLGTGLSSVRIPSSVQSINYCAFGYDKNFKAIRDFVIYGSAGGAGERYASDEDSENDYKNNFSFISDESTSEAEVSEGDTSESLNFRLIISIILGGVALIAIIAVVAVTLVHRVSNDKNKKNKN